MPRGRPPKKPIAEKISSSLDIAQIEINKLLPEVHQETLVPSLPFPEIIEKDSIKITKDVSDDYEFSRDNLHGLLEKGNKVLDTAINLASDTDSPRTIEVVGNLIKVLLDGTRELMTLQKDVRDVIKKTSSSEESSSINIAQADNVNILEGTTLEMLDALQELKRRKLETQTEKEKGITNG
jgi:hypothetical protein